MTANSSRQSKRVLVAGRRRPDLFSRPRCEPLEDRLAPALFEVQSPLSFSGLNNNGCVAVTDLDKDGFADAILTNFGTDYATGAGSTITWVTSEASPVAEAWTFLPAATKTAAPVTLVSV